MSQLVRLEGKHTTQTAQCALEKTRESGKLGQSPLACGCSFAAKTLESVLPLMIVYVLFGF